MEPYVFLGYHAWGITSVLISFAHEQYPFKSNIDPWCLYIEYLNEGISFLVKLCNTLSHVKIYVMKPNAFMGSLKRGIVGVLNSFGHEQYPIDSLDQNNSAHGVYSVMQ